MYRTMAVVRELDIEAGNLQRQGQMALWVPAIGQEACQVGSALASRPQDSIFPAYREHSGAGLHGVSMLLIFRMLRGLTHGGWDPKTHNNFHLYTLVIGSHTLHTTGYPMCIGLDSSVAHRGRDTPTKSPSCTSVMAQPASAIPTKLWSLLRPTDLRSYFSS
jgi:Pyruvate/2-oxoglutarate dehydrogenase complex, dehydrogenase (E1) component, eukaryotic type, alpha subunit